MLNNKGQTLIFVAFVMIIALSIGVVISDRIIGGLNRSSGFDSSARALGVAQALSERVLALPNTTLDAYIQNNNCSTACNLSITGSDGVISTATATLSYAGSTATEFNVSVQKDSVYEVNLSGFSNSASINVCWENADSGNNPSVVASHVYGTSSYSIVKYAHNSTSTVYTANGFSTAGAYLSYPNCFTVTAKTNPKLLRVRAVYNDLKLHIIPQSGSTLPVQGYLITSVGAVNNVKRTVKYIKSSAFSPFPLDFAIFSTSETSGLGN